MPFQKAAMEWLEKSGLSEKAKKACGEAMKSLTAAKSEFSPEQFKSFRKALAYNGEETDAEEKLEAEKKGAMKKSADDATASLDEAKELIKKSVSYLDAAAPAIKPALDALSSFIGHKPVHQILAELPEAARVQIELLQKSSDETRKELEMFKKSAAEAARTARARELVQKSAETLKHVPLSAEDLGTLINDVTEANPEAAKKLETLLGAVEGVMAKSGIFSPKGVSGHQPAGESAEAKIENLARAMVQKSAEGGAKVPMSKAWNLVMETYPELAKQYDSEKTAKSSTAGLSE